MKSRVMPRLSWLFLLLCGLLCTVQAASKYTPVSICDLLLTQVQAPISFCKCICAGNSTIIQLRDQIPDTKPSSSDRPIKAGTCNDCNRQFCISSKLPICKGVDETAISTSCFQRDSVKDEAVVWVFILSTASLLIWAAAKPWMAPMFEVRSWVNICTAGLIHCRKHDRRHSSMRRFRELERNDNDTHD